ncbi:MAG: hypothetical protein ACXITV_10310 [Luteibaculaceae bacterium]
MDFKKIIGFNLAYYYAKFFLSHTKKIEQLKNKYSGETFYIIGGGPSLNETDLGLLNNKTVIFTNYSYKLIDKINPKVKIWAIQDYRRQRDLKDVDKSIFDYSFRVLWGYEYFRDLLKGIKVYSRSDLLIVPPKYGLLKQNNFKPELLFSKKLNYNLQITGDSIMFSAIQIAFHLGAKNIVLLGLDLNITPNKSHFDSNRIEDVKVLEYCFKGSQQALGIFKEKLENLNIKLINASPNTADLHSIKMDLSEAVLL